MNRKILIIIYIVFILIFLKLLYSATANYILIDKYNKGEYDDDIAKTLKYCNFSQSYVANYNYGNILYKIGKYNEAIEEYKKALEGAIPKYKECSIRINYALSICKTVEVDEEDQNSINNAIEKYESAVEILTQKDCANKNNNGHNQNAQQLKNDIEEEIDRLKNLQKEEDESNEEEQKNEKNEQSIEEEEAKTIEEKIQNIKENAIKEQREKEGQYVNYKKEMKDFYTKNW